MLWYQDILQGAWPSALGRLCLLSGSSLARNLVLHLLKEDINQEKLTQAQAQKDLFSQAMRGYLEWLAPQIDSSPPILQKTLSN
ncbi:MAG: hypothetical protein V9E95_07205 [Methanothrix soehngenii]